LGDELGDLYRATRRKLRAGFGKPYGSLHVVCGDEAQANDGIGPAAAGPP